MSTPTPSTSPSTPTPSTPAPLGPPTAPADGWHRVTVETDGRRVAVLDTGEPDLPVLLMQSGTPASYAMDASLLEAGRRAGVRLVTWARPGYRGSDRLPGRTVADVVGDAVAILDHLGVERCATYGHSGGGPHALALGALLPQRTVAVACVCGVAPYDVPSDRPSDAGFDWLDGMGQGNIDEFGACRQGEGPLRTLLEQWHPGLAGADGPGLVREMRSLLPDVDVAVLTDELGEESAASTRWCLADGVDGWLDDDLAFVRPWGFELGAIRVPVAVWQGSDDLMVPAAHGRLLADRIPTAQPHLLDGEGHLSIATGRLDEHLSWLRDRLVEAG